jgi:hypothetical protein
LCNAGAAGGSSDKRLRTTNGGKTWRGVSSASLAFDVLDASHAWLVGLGSGLWRTTDGLRWRRVGPLPAY